MEGLIAAGITVAYLGLGLETARAIWQRHKRTRHGGDCPLCDPGSLCRCCDSASATAVFGAILWPAGGLIVFATWYVTRERKWSLLQKGSREIR